MPCLRTKVFWAPIANIRENPRKKPVKKADIKIYSLFPFCLDEILQT